MSDGFLETRVFRFTYDDLAKDPTLMHEIEGAWVTKDWFALFGVWPVGAVLATRDDEAITFRFKAEAP